MAIEKRMDHAGKPAYRVRIATRHPATGARQNTTVGTFRTKREAERAERDALTHKERGTLLDPAKTTVAELFDTWLGTKAGNVSGNSLRDYEIAIRLHLKPSIGTVPVQGLTPERVQVAYSAWQAAGMSARMVHRCHIVLSQALALAVRYRLVAYNVAAEVSKPSVGRGKPDVWNTDEARRFLDASRMDSLHPLWHLLLLEGLRRGEALGARWSDVNWERGTVHISQSVAPDKSNKGAAMIQERTKTATAARTVRLTADTLEALREHRTRWLERKLAAATWTEHDLIVCTGRGTPINPNNVSRSFAALVERGGVRRIRVHDLRHTSATLLLLAGTPAKVVSERLGHASIGITLDLYSHVLPSMQDDAALAISRILGNARTGT